MDSTALRRAGRDARNLRLLVVVLVAALAAELLELGEDSLHIELASRLLGHRRFGLWLCGGDFRWQQGHPRLSRQRLLLRRARNFEIEVDLRAQPERHRI